MLSRGCVSPADAEEALEHARAGVSAYDVAQANLQLAVEFSRGLIQAEGDKMNNVVILLPDEDEKAIAIERYTRLTRDKVTEDTYNVEPGVTVSSLRTIDGDDERYFKVRSVGSAAVKH